MISFSKCTAEQYAGLTPVTDRIYYITDTGEIYLNGVKYGSGEITQIQSDWDQSDSTAADYIKDKPALAPVATSGNYYSLSNRPYVPNATGDWFAIWHDSTDTVTTTVTLSVSGTNARANTFQYCTNISSNNWADYTLGTAITLTQYQYVLWRNKDAVKLLGNATGHYVFSITGGGVYLAGNIMTLKDKGGQSNDHAGGYDFYQMFQGCTAIKDASMLKLPAALINNYSYYQMFKGCTGMVYGPMNVGATNAPASSMYGMFENCTSMVAGPDVLPATVLGAQCYRFMFNGCTALTKAPELPATTLASMCYHSMFRDCTSLTETPYLPAATVASLAYNFMFQGCTALNHIRTAATALGTDNSQSWMTNVASSGVIECPYALDLSTRGSDTAPLNWKAVRTDKPQADWTQTDYNEASYIRNKPTIPAAQVQADWTVGPGSVAYIKYKFMGMYNGGQGPITSSIYQMTYGDGRYALLAPDGDVTIVNPTFASGILGYAEIAIDLKEGFTVIAGANTELVDPPVPGKRNIYVSRLEGGVGKMYLVIVEDIPGADESSSI